MYLTVRAVEDGLYPEVCYFRFIWGPEIEKMVDFQWEKKPFRLKLDSIHYLGESEEAPKDTNIEIVVFAVKSMLTAPEHYCFGAYVVSGWPDHEGRLIEGWIRDDGSGLFILASTETYVLAGYDRTIQKVVEVRREQ